MEKAENDRESVGGKKRNGRKRKTKMNATDDQPEKEVTGEGQREATERAVTKTEQGNREGRTESRKEGRKGGDHNKEERIKMEKAGRENPIIEKQRRQQWLAQGLRAGRRADGRGGRRLSRQDRKGEIMQQGKRHERSTT